MLLLYLYHIEAPHGVLLPPRRPERNPLALLSQGRRWLLHDFHPAPGCFASSALEQRGETRLHCEAFNAALQWNARREAILPWNTFEIMRLLHVFLSLPESFRKLLLIFLSIHEYFWLRLFCDAQTQTSISQFRDRLDFYTWNRQNLYIVCWNVQHSEISGWLCTAAERAPRGVPCCWINQQVNQAWT